MTLRIGVSLKSRHAHADPRDGARVMIDRARAADAAELDSLFVGDHHAVPDGYYQNVPILARMLADWNGTAGAFFVLPLWHPVLLAEQVATLASISHHPFVMQCAVGGGADQFSAMGVGLDERAARFEHGLSAVRTLLAGEEVHGSGPFAFGPTRISPVPTQGVEVWIGGHARPAIDRASRMGDGWMAGPGLTVEDSRRLVALYEERCEISGRGVGRLVIRRDVFVGRDSAHAISVVGDIVTSGYRGIDPAALVVGGPEEVAVKLAALAEVGFTDILVRHIGGAEEEVLESFERLGGVRAALV